MQVVGVGVCEWFLLGSQVCVEKLWAGLVFDAGKVDRVTSVVGVGLPTRRRAPVGAIPVPILGFRRPTRGL